MKHSKLICLTLATVLLLTSCTRITSRRDRHNDDDEEETIETEDTVSADMEPITEESIDGIWLTDTGFLCQFDTQNDMFYDCYGTPYHIISINDYDVVLSTTASEQYMYCEDYGVPTGGTLTVDAHFEDGCLHTLGSEAYRLDSAEGQELDQALRERIEGQSFYVANSTYNMEFNDDLTTISLVGLGTTQDLQIDYNGGTVTIEEYENEMLVIWQMNGNIMFCMNGQIGFVEENTDLAVNWLHYDKGTDELTLLDFTSGNTAVNEDVPYYEAASYTSIICTDNGEYMGVPTQPGVFVNTEIMEQYSNSSSDDTDYYIDMRSPFASTMLMRDDIINEDPGTISVHQLQFEEGYISYESFDNVWPDTIVSVVEYAENEYWNQNSYDLLSPVSNYYYVTMRRDYPVQIVFECDEVPEGASIYYLESSIGDDPEEVETTYSGDLAMAIIDRSGIYFFG